MLGRSTYHYATVLPPIENCPLNHVLGRAVDFTFGYTMTQSIFFQAKVLAIQQREIFAKVY